MSGTAGCVLCVPIKRRKRAKREVADGELCEETCGESVNARGGRDANGKYDRKIEQNGWSERTIPSRLPKSR